MSLDFEGEPFEEVSVLAGLVPVGGRPDLCRAQPAAAKLPNRTNATHSRIYTNKVRVADRVNLQLGTEQRPACRPAGNRLHRGGWHIILGPVRTDPMPPPIGRFFL
jgi:hypothetical protein